jgi:MATE family multidrug resistance protein
VALSLSAAVMLLNAILFIVFRHWIPHLYTRDAAVIAAAAAIFPVGAAFQVFDGVQVAGMGVLRGMGRTRPAAAMNLVAYWVLGLPLGWWLAFRQGVGLAGIWWGLALGLATVAIMLIAWIAKRGPAHVDARVYREESPAAPAGP